MTDSDYLREILAELRNISTLLSTGQLSFDFGPSEPTLSQSVNDVEAFKEQGPQQAGLFDDLETPPPASEPAPDKPAPKREDVIAALNALAKRRGPEMGKQVLAGVGVTRLAELPEEKYNEVIERCTVL